MNNKLIKGILFLFLLASNSIEAQFIKETAIQGQIGFGSTAPYRSSDEIVNSGFFAQGELVLKAASWFELRPYLGFISTSSDGEDVNGNPTDEKAESKAVLLGGKARVRAPIPWVAPYLELGIGTSIGEFETLTFYHDIEKGGIIPHIPFSLGLELGRNHDVDVGVALYYQPTVKQGVAALSFGLTFPINTKD
ncbi:hypothetical protein [Aquimarina brevivitae]|uniref:Outer membrane protein with beta-barrel domain n=1 Tax=Aquimarina brevivitae TaxID=323412 RepID=A0A4Q7NY47_9FLAO|nr:hypothetical protein [Aquimarina brevivitae]RZS91868.1 hypothetical protein EV197_2971 [Aquimarina brevivitae]